MNCANSLSACSDCGNICVLLVAKNRLCSTTLAPTLIGITIVGVSAGGGGGGVVVTGGLVGLVGLVTGGLGLVLTGLGSFIWNNTANLAPTSSE